MYAGFWFARQSSTIRSLGIGMLNASLHLQITHEEREIIMHAKKSLLYNKGEVWSKTTADQLFDVTMGSYDSAETCELVGTFLL